ncbi:hypothetical protein FOZ62_020236, partial [Perkinsus olseni]
MSMKNHERDVPRSGIRKLKIIDRDAFTRSQADPVRLLREFMNAVDSDILNLKYKAMGTGTTAKAKDVRQAASKGTLAATSTRGTMEAVSSPNPCMENTPAVTRPLMSVLDLSDAIAAERGYSP